MTGLYARRRYRNGLCVLATFIAFGASDLAFARASLRPAEADGTAIIGRWINPYGSVVVETQPCGERLCGRVSWANPEAQQDARDSGVPSLIGTQLLEDYRPAGSRQWRGRVYVPDLGHSFQSTIVMEDTGTLRISGCILGGLICKSQRWRRQS
ncbi:MAG: DUF2147 domain-containing protein [Sphingomonas sp.]|nr:DUF2147 domain-containing protein [Sphingomonas sp.]